MAKQYEYTIYKQDGTTETVVAAKKEFQGDDGIYALIGNGCDHIEMLPKDYVPKSIGKAGNFYIDGEGRFNPKLVRNPHFQVLTGDIFDPGMEWDVIGNVVREKPYHG